MKQINVVLILGLLLPGLMAGGCAFQMGDGSPVPGPGYLMSATVPFGQDDNPAQSAPVILYETDRLIMQSDIIILGQVAEILPSKGYTPASSEDMQYNIYTDIIIDVDREFWGKAGDRVVVRVQGGKIGNLVMWAEDVPLFARGEKALLFLYHPGPEQTGIDPSPDESGSYFLVAGAMQGKYEYQNNTFISLSGRTITPDELEQKIARIYK